MSIIPRPWTRASEPAEIDFMTKGCWGPAYMPSRGHIINSMPAELLLEIFKYVCFQPYSNIKRTARPVLRIAAVCGRFREIIESSPIIWANTIDFNTPRLCVEHFLTLSGDILPIHRAQLQPLRCDLEPHHRATWQWATLLRKQVLERCHLLEFEIQPCMLSGLRDSFSTRGVGSMKIKITENWPWSACQFSGSNTSIFVEGEAYSNLVSLVLEEGSFKLSSSIFPALKNLSISLARTSCLYTNSMMNALEWVEFLKQLPQLESLYLDNAVKKQSRADTTFPAYTSPVVLPALKSLVLIGMHYNLGDLFENLRVPPSCNIKIETEIKNRDIHSAGSQDTIGKLMHFLQVHFSAERAVPFGPTLYLAAKSYIITHVQVANFIESEGYNRAVRRNRIEGGDVGIPTFSLDIRSLLTSEDHNGPNSPIYTRLHDGLASTGLAVPFKSVTDVFLCCDDDDFAVSPAQKTFLLNFDNVRRLDMLRNGSLFNISAIQQRGDVQQALFPKLEILGVLDMNGGDSAADPIYVHFVEGLKGFLDARKEKSVVPNVRRVVLGAGFGMEQADKIEKMLGGFGIFDVEYASVFCCDEW